MWADFSQTGKLINRKQQIGRAKNIEWIVYVDGGNREFYFYTPGESFSAVGFEVRYSRDRNVRVDHTGVVDQFRRPHQGWCKPCLRLLQPRPARRASETTSSTVCEITNTLRPTPNWFEAAVFYILCSVYNNNPRLFADNRVNYFREILVRKKHSKIHSSSLSAKRKMSLAELISCARWYANRAILSSLYVWTFTRSSHIFAVMTVPRIN